jgi:small-conductance mechanosensitive channel/CRP-like cAMP-binding protein
MAPVRVDELFLSQDLWMGVVFALVAVLMLAIAPRERRHVLRLGVLYLASLALHLASGLLGAAGLPGAPAAHLVARLAEGVAVISLFGAALFGAALPALRVQPSKILRDLTIALSCLAFFLWLLSTRRVDVAGIVATSAVITAVIGLSLQDFLSNVMGGLALQLDGSVVVGDWVRFGDVVGIVREVSWRHMAIETRNGDTLVVPNSQLMRNPVLLLGKTAEGGPIHDRRWIYFHVDYRFAPTAVIGAVTEALRREPILSVAPEPAPDAIFLAFKESYAEYAVRYWLTDLFADDRTDSTVRMRIWFALKRAGIPLAIPAQSVFVTPEDDGRRSRIQEEEKALRRAAVGRVPVFAPLTLEEREWLAEGLLFTPCAAGEAIVLQGAAANHLYILTKGSAEVRVSVEGAAPRAVATLAAPDVFGEMGMLTGEPRRATVVALEETECWRLTKEAFHGILAARPALAEEISRLLAEREVELAAAREGLSEEAKRLRLREEQRSLLSKIRGFFAIA